MVCLADRGFAGSLSLAGALRSSFLLRRRPSLLLCRYLSACVLNHTRRPGAGRWQEAGIKESLPPSLNLHRLCFPLLRKFGAYVPGMALDQTKCKFPQSPPPLGATPTGIAFKGGAVSPHKPLGRDQVLFPRGHRLRWQPARCVDLPFPASVAAVPRPKGGQRVPSRHGLLTTSAQWMLGEARTPSMVRVRTGSSNR